MKRCVPVSVSIILLTLLATVMAAAPATSPSRTPATHPADMEPLVDGSLRYLTPAGWKQVSRSEDNLRVSFVSGDGFGRIDLTVIPQTRDVEEAQAGPMAMIIGKGIRESAKKNNRELILQPRVEKDPRFFLIVHDRLRPPPGETTGTAEERVNDRMNIYRVLGLNLVNVASNAFSRDEAEATEVHDTAKKLLADMRLVRGVAPAVFPRSNLKITPPVDWKTTRADQANGLVATYAPPEVPPDSPPNAPHRQIIVRSRVLPKDAREDAARRDTLLERMIDEERRTAPFTATLKPGEEQSASGGDDKALRRIQTPLVSAGGKKFQVTTSYRVVGDVLVSVRSVSDELDESTAKLADTLAGTIKPIK